MPPQNESDKSVQIVLSPDEALVLFNWLSRVNESEELSFDHAAEQRVLWDLECVLETKLVEPLKPNYDELVRKAREAICGGDAET